MLYLRWLRAEENNHSGQHRAAYDVLAWGLWRESGIRHAWLERQDRGKPFLPMYPQVHVNVTHCRFLAAAAVDAAPVGVDAEIAQMAAFLVSDLASFTTGAFIPVCGGRVMPAI